MSAILNPKTEALPKPLESFYDLYFEYVGITEVPIFYNRWCPIAVIGALLERQCWFVHGHWLIYPNMYIMLIGDPAARKTTAIQLAQKALAWTGYDRFSADKSSKERFLFDLLNIDFDETDIEEIEELIIDEPAQRFIVSDEFTDFVGKHNLEFLTMLSKLWDNKDKYEHPKLHGKSIVVDKPTVNILSASQPEMLYSAFPPEAIGQGIMSRFILVYGEPTGIKITYPKTPTEQSKMGIRKRLEAIKQKVTGQMHLTPLAETAIDTIYKDTIGILDYRFKHYNNRRLTHLLKLSMILAAMDLRIKIDVQDVVRANTLLHVTEQRMPRALGEFGASRNSEIANKAIQILQDYRQPVSIKVLFNELSNDLESYDQLIQIMTHLKQAEKVKTIKIGDKTGWVPIHKIEQKWKDGLIDKEFLTAEEFL